MKRTITLLAALVALVAAGCGSSGDDGAAGEATTTQAAATTGPQALKVGLITDLGQLNDHGFNQLAYRGLKQAERELGVEGRVVQSASAADYVPSMARLARDGYDLIVAVGYAQGDAVATAAKRFPETRFAIVDVSQADLKGGPKNAVGLVFKEQEAGFLAGYAAALAEKRRPGKDVIGAVGGMKEPPVDRFIAGYQAGAKEADPGIEILNGYSQDWDDLAKCKELALTQIGRGAGVVFQVAGGCGLGALDAAKERKVWGVGVDADQSYLGPHVLTSAQKKVDRAVFLTIKSIQEDEWQGGRDLTFGLAEGGVGVGKFSPNANKADVAQVEKVKADVVSGKIAVPAELQVG
jgi:basic membrane protein A